jgi:hypothetical protein
LSWFGAPGGAPNQDKGSLDGGGAYPGRQSLRSFALGYYLAAPSGRRNFAGQFTLHFTNGTSARGLFQLGHTNANYEFTWTNGLFAVPRSTFMATLAAAGVSTNDGPTKS